MKNARRCNFGLMILFVSVTAADNRLFCFTNPINRNGVNSSFHTLNQYHVIIFGNFIVLKIQFPNAFIITLQDISAVPFDEFASQPKAV